jgi:hypothetical protein
VINSPSGLFRSLVIDLTEIERELVISPASNFWKIRPLCSTVRLFDDDDFKLFFGALGSEAEDSDGGAIENESLHFWVILGLLELLL